LRSNWQFFFFLTPHSELIAFLLKQSLASG